MTRVTRMMFVAALTASLAGCAARRMSSPRSTVPPYPPPAAPNPYAPPPTPFPVEAGPPPGAFALPPSGPAPVLSAPPPGAFPVAPPPPAGAFPVAPPPNTSQIPQSELDRVGYRWQPTVPPTQPPPTAPPAYTPPSAAPDVVLLPPIPDTAEPPRDARPNERRQLYPPTPPPGDRAPFPIGIPGFDKVRESVVAGQRPSLEGLDWLQQRGFRTVVFLHAPGERLVPERDPVERRGMTFLPIEVDARQPAKAVFDLFLEVNRGAHGKAFVYDLTGALAGPLWYVAFRTIDGDSDDIARIRARGLGLREEIDGPSRDLWVAGKRYVDGN